MKKMRIRLVGIKKSCISGAYKRFSEVKVVPFLCCRSDHVIPQSLGHVLVSNERGMKTVKLRGQKNTKYVFMKW